MPPSDNANFSVGNFRSTGDQSRSAAAWTMLIGCKLISTSMGASTDVTTRVEDEPMCMQTIVPSSQQADQKGSQCSLWRLGSLSFSGFSEKETAWQPFSATRW